MALPNKTKIPVGYVLSGKYRVTREIGRGGMAAVYEAENIDIGKRVAIKVLAQELTSSAVVVERFLREARAAAAIRSPYICDVYDSGRLEDGRPFLVLELLEGESLYELMTRVRHMDVFTTVNVITQTCRGLTKAHASSIVHRDLKPENIFITKDEEGNLLTKILDFGLAKFYAPLEGTGGEKQARLTREGAVFGTPAYMSPEQVRGQGAVDHRADLWALGCITYECLTGRTVWATEQGVAMTFAQIANSPLPRPAKYRPDLALKFTDWFDRALDRDIERRFQTAKEFAEELILAFGQPATPSLATPQIASMQIAPTDLVEVSRPIPVMPSPSQAVHDLTDRRYSPDAVTERPSANPRVPSVSLSAEEPVVVSEPPGPTQRNSKIGFAAPPGAGDFSRSSGQVQRPSREVRPTGGSGRVIVVVGAIGLAASAAYAGWRQFVRQPTTPVLTVSSAGVDAGNNGVPSAIPSAIPSNVSTAAALPWKSMLAEAQGMIATDNLKGAQKILGEAFDKSGHGVPQTMKQQVLTAMSGTAKSTCKMTGLGRPRTYDLVSANAKPVGAGRPSIALGPRGPVMTWTDAHEGSNHAYAVLFDDAMRNASAVVDVTPEGSDIGRPELLPAGEKLVLTYWDGKGGEAGPKVRWLDADGRIGGPAVAIAAAKGGSFWPSLIRRADGSFFVTWTSEVDDSEDLFLRALTPTLEPKGDAVRVTDYFAVGSKPRARQPWIARHEETLHIVYRLEREPMHFIQHLRLPIADTTKSMPPSAGGPRADRTLGEGVLVNTDRSKGDAPAIACSGSGCYVVWHGEFGGGASAAYVDPVKGQPLWRKKFSKTGAHPAVAVSTTGDAQVAWFDRGGLMIAPINRDGVGATTKIARVLGDQPMPSIAPGGRPGEWYIAWLDYESGHVEPYAVRVLCK